MSASPLARSLRALERWSLRPEHACLVDPTSSNLLDEVNAFDGLVQMHIETGEQWDEPIALIQETSTGSLRLLLEKSRDVVLFPSTAGEIDFRIRSSALAAIGVAHSPNEPHTYVLDRSSSHGGGTGAGVDETAAHRSVDHGADAK